MEATGQKEISREELNGKQWLTPAEAIRYSGLGRTRMYAFLRSNELMSAKIGARRYIRRTDLDAFIASFMEQV